MAWDPVLRRLVLLLYVSLPWPLWYLSFSSPDFVEYMFLSTFILALSTLMLFRGIPGFRPEYRVVPLALLYAMVLYILFVLGKFLSQALGMMEYVDSVYNALNTLDEASLMLLLGLIGFFEEAYWRGGIQEGLLEREKAPWILSTLPYSLVHLATGNPVLVAAAWIVGIVLGHEAHRLGVMASALSHVVWLYMVILFLPLS